MKRFIDLFFLLTSLFPATQLPAQSTIVPADTSLNLSYLKPRNVFQRLTWMNKEGKIVGQATLNCITRIDSVNKRLTYLQIRNDGKNDSTIAEWPSLRPVYTATIYASGKQVFDYRGGQLVRTQTESNGKIIKDSSFSIAGSYFDSFLTDYLLGALPLKEGYQAQFQTCQAAKAVTMKIRPVHMDVLLLGDGQMKQVFSLQLEFNGYNVLYSIDKSTGDLIRSVVQLPDGSLFIKSKI